jgi:hypothetical protein
VPIFNHHRPCVDSPRRFTEVVSSSDKLYPEYHSLTMVRIERPIHNNDANFPGHSER